MESKRTFTNSVASAALGLLALQLSAGCGGGEAEDQLRRVQTDLQGAREAIFEAEGRIEEREEALTAAKLELEEAKNDLEAATARLAKVESSVDFRTTDALLFRGIQKRLLDDGDLEATAIRASVHKGVVTLYGTVPHNDAMETALGIAQEFPGVVSVENRIEVQVAAPPPEN